MRDIKFRCHIRGRKKLVYNFTLESVDVSDDGNNILMQYTGLQDKNGTDIYEGDVLNDGTNINKVVIFENGAFGYLVKKRASFHSEATVNIFVTLYQNLEELEIVGNIYENPELIS